MYNMLQYYKVLLDATHATQPCDAYVTVNGAVSESLANVAVNSAGRSMLQAVTL